MELHTLRVLYTDFEFFLKKIVFKLNFSLKVCEPGQPNFQNAHLSLVNILQGYNMIQRNGILRGVNIIQDNMTQGESVLRGVNISQHYRSSADLPY